MRIIQYPHLIAGRYYPDKYLAEEAKQGFPRSEYYTLAEHRYLYPYQEDNALPMKGRWN